MHRRSLHFGFASLALMALSACAGLLGPPTLTLSEQEISRVMARQFPLERSLLDVFDVTVQAPRVRLLPERGRLAAVVDLGLDNRLLRRQWQGQLSFDAELRWSPADQTVRLSQVRVHDLALVDPGALGRNAAERLGAALAERVLEGSAVYRLPADRAAQLRARGYQPGGVTVSERGLEFRFVPLSPAMPAMPASTPP